MAAAESHPPILALRGLNRRHLTAAVVVAALVALATLGWSEWHGSSKPTATATHQGTPTAVSGVVLIEGGPPPPPGSTAHGAQGDAHARIVVTGTTSLGAHLLRRFTADAHGRFALKLPPGTYSVAAVVDTTAPLASQPHQQITVAGGHPVQARIVIQAS